MKNKKFTFEISINTIPYNKSTCKELYGGEYNSDFPESALASEIVSCGLQESVCACLEAEIDHLVQCECDIKNMNERQQKFHEYLREKTRTAKAVAASYKFVRSEEIS